MTQLFQSKSILAKLLAQENIIVEHRKVPTAYFDLKHRVMVLPIFKEMTGELYDLLAGHEVGHALFTPEKGWHNAVMEDKSLKSYLNVVEDARIERKIKEKFPGLARSFNIAYKRLLDDDFFGINDRDVNRMRFIDRINIFYKLGAHVRVTFSGEELSILNEINAAETWEQIEAIARKIYQKAKEDKQNNPEPEMPMDDLDSDFDNDSSDDGDDDSFEYDLDDDSDGDSDSDSDETEDSESEKSGNSDDADAEESDDNSDSDDENLGEGNINQRDTNHNPPPQPSKDDVSSETDNAFRQNEQRLLDNSNDETFIANLPTYNKNCIVSHKLVHAAIRQSMTKSIGESYHLEETKKFINHNTVVAYQEFIKRTNSVVNYMVKEFEMRKNASQLARARVGKSGKINPKKLARYNMDTDIFQRITNVPQGKNHGLVMFIDLSGSMCDIIGSVFEQAIVLTQFCKKVNLPFEVYGFSDSLVAVEKFGLNTDGQPYSYCQLKPNDLCVNDRSFHLKQYLSNTMPSNVYREAVQNMLFVGAAYNRDRYGHYDLVPDTERLQSTPLDEAIIASIDVVSEFKRNYRLDNVNSIFLTDGQGGMSNHMVGDNNRAIWMSYKSSVYLQHKQTKDRVRVQSLLKSNDSRDDFMYTRAIIELAQKTTGAKYTGYFIANKREICRMNHPYEYSYSNGYNEQIKNMGKRIVDNGFLASTKFGFAEYFMVLNNNLKIEESKIDVAPDAKKGVLARAFIKSMNTRGLQRMFLNRFIENIAA
jgi:hypothetical protein